ncbi:MAG: fused MFS/spermidine synthase [Bacteroidetes bacterium]|nr:fused MFS/spermidine synthase [Bacteroidota bacterium]
MKPKSDFFTRTTVLLAWIFFFSGFSSLIYQVVWQRVLTMHYGLGAISMTLIVSIYMFGLGIGALIGGYLAERVRKKILLYFFIELLIGVFGIISLPFLKLLGIYTAGSSYPLVSVYVFLFLSIPTLLMGITLPLLTKIFNSYIQNFLNSVSFLYFINTLGAAFGALITSYVIISLFGLDTGVYIAVIINLILAGLIFVINRKSAPAAAKPVLQEQKESEYKPLNRYLVYSLVFVTGFLAIGYEIIWFRVVGIFVKASPYVFSSVLAVYLFGIALGSYFMNRFIRKRTIDRRNVFFLIQFLIGAFVLAAFLGYYYLTRYTGFEILTRLSFTNLYHPDPNLPSTESLRAFFLGLYKLFDIFFWAGIFVLIPTLLMGASFPLISSLALERPDREGSTIGRVYFFNIVGNVLGGILTGFVILPAFSSETTILAFIIVGILFGLFINRYRQKQLRTVVRVAVVAVLIVSGILFMPGPGQLYKTIHVQLENNYETYLEEGIDGVVITFVKGDSMVNYINGIQHGWRPLYSYHFEAGEAIFYSKKVENVLVIGFGNGTITEIVLEMPNLKKVTSIEINHALIKNLNKMEFFREMFADPRLELVVDDGRRYLLNSNETFDLILIDPLRTRTAYSNNLYSDYFFREISDHLTPDGIFMAWMDEFRVMPKTIATAFKYVRQYDFFCLASNSPFELNEEMKNILMSRFTEEEKSGRAEYEGCYLGDQDYIKSITVGYPINREWKPVGEYYLGLKIRESLLNK